MVIEHLQNGMILQVYSPAMPRCSEINSPETEQNPRLATPNVWIVALAVCTLLGCNGFGLTECHVHHALWSGGSLDDES